MGPQVTNIYSSVLIAQIIFIMLFMFPDFSLILWRSLMKKWTMAGVKMMMKRNRAAEDKLKKYWEIDIRKLK